MNGELRSTVTHAMGGRISYSQCWEDDRILTEALNIGAEDDVLSIAAAGDNVIALALAGARSVTAIDLSMPELALTELKLAGGHLDYDDYLRLLGFLKSRSRLALYRKIRHELSETSRGYWDKNGEQITNGVARCGRLECFFAYFRRFILPLIHSRRTIRSFIELDDMQAQSDFYDRHWNTFRWRCLFKIFFSQRLIALLGRDPAQFAHVEGPVAEVFLKRCERAFTEIPIRDNPYLEWILTGTYRDVGMARPYLSPEGHGQLTGLRERISLLHAELEQHLPEVGKNRYSAFNYSDLFEYVSSEQHEILLKLSVDSARPGARIAYWNLLVPRCRPERLADRLARCEAQGEALLRRDRAPFYGGFQVEVVQ